MSLRRSKRASKPVQSYAPATTFRSSPKVDLNSQKKKQPSRTSRSKNDVSAKAKSKNKSSKRKRTSRSRRKKNTEPLHEADALDADDSDAEHGDDESDDVESITSADDDDDVEEAQLDDSVAKLVDEGPKFQVLFRDFLFNTQADSVVARWISRYRANHVVAMQELAAFLLYVAHIFCVP